MYLINKYSYEGKNSHENSAPINLIYRGKVISTDDSSDAGRIKVRIIGLDNELTDNETFTAFPLLPKHLNVVPKVGEGVLIFTFNTNSKYVDRMYMGPIIPQPQNLDFAGYDLEAWNAFSFGNRDLGPAPINRKKIRGGFPSVGEIAIQGRKNSDLILKDNEVLIRAGKFVFKGDNADDSKSSDEFDEKLDMRFNTRSQGYIQIKYNTPISVPKNENEKPEYGTVTNIVSNKINLLTHKHGNPRFTLTNQDNLISEEELIRILEEAHPLAFGDKVVEVFRLIIKAITSHSHKYPGMKPHAEGQSDGAIAIQNLTDYDLSQILSKNIRIN